MGRSRASLSGIGLMLLLVAFATACSAQTDEKASAAAVDPKATTAQEFPVWPGIAPGSEAWAQKEGTIDVLGVRATYNVVRPTLTAFFPDPATATGTAVIVAPGGGFRFLNMADEGTEVAHWLTRHGIAAFVLKYRTEKMPDSSIGFLLATRTFLGRLSNLMAQGEKGLPLVGKPDTTGSLAPANMLDWPFYAADDGREAVKVVRSFAEKWRISPHKIGFMGFSAGAAVTYGVLASASPAEMPDFAAPMYFSLSQDVALPADVPPIFLGAASDDPISRGMPATYIRLAATGHSAELHMWAKGGHGFGMTRHGQPTDDWIETFYRWLKVEGFAGTQ